jgi:hypothetical protein
VNTSLQEDTYLEGNFFFSLSILSLRLECKVQANPDAHFLSSYDSVMLYHFLRLIKRNFCFSSHSNIFALFLGCIIITGLCNRSQSKPLESSLSYATEHSSKKAAPDWYLRGQKNSSLFL